MKKFKLFLCTFLLSVLVFSTTVCAYNPTNSGIQYYRLPGTPYYFTTDQYMSGDDAALMMTIEYFLPEKLKTFFRQEGVKVYFTKGVPYYERTYENGYFNGYCQGPKIYYSGTKVTKVSGYTQIYLYDDAPDISAALHEYGHALDYIAGYKSGYYYSSSGISDTNEWRDLYSKYGFTLTGYDSQAMSNVPLSAEEGFAEAFRIYFWYGNLQAVSPEIANFVSKQVEKYSAYAKEITYSNFDPEFYYSVYPDVAEACGTDKKALWDHYVNYGKAEGRKAACVIPGV